MLLTNGVCFAIMQKLCEAAKSIWGYSSAGSPVEAVNNPRTKTQYLHSLPFGGIAQLGERLNGIQEVSGSIPLISTITKRV